jgi:two-component system, OmpR family, phosphate regulon sensor histidine kinase PhoR
MEAVVIVLVLVAVASALGWARERVLRSKEAQTARRELAEQRARREAELREQSQRTASLFDRMVEGLIVVDATGRIRLANRAAAGLFRFEAPATGKTILEATRHHDVASLVSRLDREPEVLDHELRIESMDAPRFIQVNALALRGSGGSSDGAILVFHDLTRLRQLEGVRQEFVANVSHELRTPLSLIKSASETLLDGASADPAALGRFLSIIDKHANRLALLIDDLLLLSTLDSGGLRLDRQPLPFRITVQDAIDDLRPRALARDTTLENLVPASLVVVADNDRMRQVIFNLLDNGIKYGRAGGTTTVEGRLLENGLAEIAVVDDGPGIPRESQDRIFERFYRVDKARSREQGGTGLGLAIVKHVVQAHGGEVRVESTPGFGSRFVFTVPAAAEHRPAALSGQAEKAPGRA